MILMNKNNTKKILILHNRYQNIGGEDIAVDQEVEALKKFFTVKELYFSNQLENYLNDIFGLLTSNNKKSKNVLIKLIENFEPDIVYIHNTWFKASLGIFNELKKRNIKTILKIHNFRFDCTRFHSAKLHFKDDETCFKCGNHVSKSSIYNKYFEESFLKSFLINRYGIKYFEKILSNDLSIFVLTKFQKEYLETLGVNKNNIYIQPNLIKFSDEELNIVREKSFTYAGRISNEKGLNELINAFKLSNLKDYKLNIIGTGPLLNKIQQENLKFNNINFYGEIDNHSVLKVIRSTKAVITATRMFEGQPTILCEASINKTPSIYPDFGGMSEFFPDNYKLSFKQFDYEDLIKKIVYVAENDTSALGVENYGFLKQKLRDDSIAQTIDTLINYE